MTRQDYEAAARIVQDYHDSRDLPGWEAIVNAFERFFSADNPRFDARRFRRACVRGANVRARG